MISDALSEAVDMIDHYLTEPAFGDIYTGELRSRILDLRGRMDAMRRELDTPEIEPGIETSDLDLERELLRALAAIPPAKRKLAREIVQSLVDLIEEWNASEDDLPVSLTPPIQTRGRKR